MKFLNIFSLATYLPIIDIPFAPGGKIVVHNASYRGLTSVCMFIIAVGLFLYFGFLKFYHAHPTWGKVIIIVGAWWLIRQIARWIKALCDDPYTRLKPYDRD